MKVRQHLQVSAEAFFAEIMTSICADIQKETKKKVRMAILEKGYSYTKRLPKRSTKNAEVIVKILDCIPNRRYCASFTSPVSYTHLNQVALENYPMSFRQCAALRKKCRCR